MPVSFKTISKFTLGARSGPEFIGEKISAASS